MTASQPGVDGAEDRRAEQAAAGAGVGAAAVEQQLGAVADRLLDLAGDALAGGGRDHRAELDRLVDPGADLDRLRSLQQRGQHAVLGGADE